MLEHTSDIEISIPFGHIAGKVWSNPKADPAKIERILGK